MVCGKAEATRSLPRHSQDTCFNAKGMVESRAAEIAVPIAGIQHESQSTVRIIGSHQPSRACGLLQQAFSKTQLIYQHLCWLA
eukprot:363451-Chlamydomonas_euryale.AAC.8